MVFDVVVVGGGTAGCVLAARLSERRERSVCLLEAGPDYGPRAEGRWPAEILDARSLPTSHGWGPGGEDGRSLGGRILGGSSAVNACVLIAGAPHDYDEWGAGWGNDAIGPYLDRARSMLRRAKATTQDPPPFQRAFLEAATGAGLDRLDDPDDPGTPTGAGAFPANVVDGRRWNAAFAYLDPARGRPNLLIADHALVDRVELESRRATGVLTADGRHVRAGTVILTAGTYFSTAILLRSGIGPETELRRLGIPCVTSLPVGKRLLDHCGTDVSWELSTEAQAGAGAAAHAAGERLFEAYGLVKAASSRCSPGLWDLHLLPWIYPGASAGSWEASAIVFHMKPLSTGGVRLRSPDPNEPPLVERRFLSDDADVQPLLEGIALARSIGALDPLRGLIADERAPGATDPERYLRETVRNYFHPAGTCAIGAVVDDSCHVLGVEGVLVADASVMPTIPRANTNLTTAAIAERVAELL